MSQETSDRMRRANQLFVEAYRLHMAGDVEAAIARYQESIASRPTAEIIWALASIPRTRWKSRTMRGNGCGPSTEPST